VVGLEISESCAPTHVNPNAKTLSGVITILVLVHSYFSLFIFQVRIIIPFKEHLPHFSPFLDWQTEVHLHNLLHIFVLDIIKIWQIQDLVIISFVFFFKIPL
jgi:hypothetical protein